MFLQWVRCAYPDHTGCRASDFKRLGKHSSGFRRHVTRLGWRKKRHARRFSHWSVVKPVPVSALDVSCEGLEAPSLAIFSPREALVSFLDTEEWASGCG